MANRVHRLLTVTVTVHTGIPDCQITMTGSRQSTAAVPRYAQKLGAHVRAAEMIYLLPALIRRTGPRSNSDISDGHQTLSTPPAQDGLAVLNAAVVPRQVVGGKRRWLADLPL